MATIWPSSETWMCPSSGLIGGPDCGTSLAPISCTLTVTSGPVSWFGVGSRIWTRAAVVGRAAALGVEPPEPSLPQAAGARVRSRATAGARAGRDRRRRVISARPYGFPAAARRSPVLGGAARRPAPAVSPARRRAGTAAAGQGQRPPPGDERHDAERQGGDGQAGGRPAVLLPAAGGGRGRGGGGRDGGGTGRAGPAGGAGGRPRGGGGHVDLDPALGLDVAVGMGEDQVDLERDRAGLVGAVDLEAPRVEGVGLHRSARPRDGGGRAGRRPAGRSAGRLPEGRPRRRGV